MRKSKILFAALAGLLLAAPALAQTTRCLPLQPCPNSPPVPFPVINPAQGLNALTNRLRTERENPQQPVATVPWNYVPVATPPPNLPPELRPQ